MTDIILASIWAFWLGILTSISPCPLATNILAISFIDKKISRPKTVFLTGLAFTLGKMITFTALAAVLVWSILAAEQVSLSLQKYMNKLLGPILIIVGMILLELLRFNMPSFHPGDKMQKRLKSLGIWSGGLLGIIFALSFCPVSAALFFGSLIPLSAKYNSIFLLPALYGVGSALPVFVFAVLVAFGAKYVGRAFNRIKEVELWIRRATGVIFIIIGIYFCLIYIFRISL